MKITRFTMMTFSRTLFFLLLPIGIALSADQSTEDQSFAGPFRLPKSIELRDELHKLLKADQAEDRGKNVNIPGLAVGNEGRNFIWMGDRAWGWGPTTCGEMEALPRRLPIENIAEIAMGNFHTLALTKDGQVWAFGANGQGQLGDGTWISRAVPKRVPIDGHVIQILALKEQSWALTKDGAIWGWGKPRWSWNDGMKNWYAPVKIGSLDSRIVQIVALENYGIARDAEGQLWYFRNDDYGPGTSNNPKPMAKIYTDAPVATMITGGNNLIMMITRNGKLRVLHDLHDGPREWRNLHSKEFFKIEFSSDLVDAAAMGDYYLLLTREGQVWEAKYLWPTRTTASFSDTRSVPIDGRVIHIGMSDYRAFALTENGELWTWIYLKNRVPEFDEPPKPYRISSSPKAGKNMSRKLKFDFDLNIGANGDVRFSGRSRL